MLLLTFANHDKARPLGVDDEMDKLQKLLMGEGVAVYPIRNLDNDFAAMTDVFKTYPNVRIFHYGGHAGPKGIDLSGGTANAKGLAQFLGTKKGLKLVFLNGCSTQEQVQHFWDAGIEAVIATLCPLNDDLARNFAQNFYRELIGGSTLEDAFKAADAVWRAKWANPAEFYADLKRGFEFDLTAPVARDFPYIFCPNPQFPAVLGEKMSDWQAEIQKKETKEVALLPEEYALLCDREDCDEMFKYLTQTLMETQQQERAWVFLAHDKADACPYDLVRRLKEYSLNELLQITQAAPNAPVQRAEILMPARILFKDRDALKYQKDWETRAAHLFESLAPEGIITLHIPLQERDWHEKTAEFFAYYLKEWLPKIQQQRKNYILSLFSLDYVDEDTDFPNFFTQLQTDYSFVTEFTQLGEIKQSHVNRWQQLYLQNKIDLVPELFPTPSTYSMRAIRPKLEAAVKRYNGQ